MNLLKDSEISNETFQKTHQIRGSFDIESRNIFRFLLSKTSGHMCEF